MPQRALEIYLNDHLTGAAGGVELARRAASNATDPERAAMWRTIADEIAADREILTRVRDAVAARPNPVKYRLARLGERLGRLKMNGRLWRHSALGEFLELEMMLIGVTGKLALWNALEQVDDPRLRDFDFHELAERADAQRSRLEQFRVSLAPSVLGER